jgi:hypothetical protein
MKWSKVVSSLAKNWVWTDTLLIGIALIMAVFPYCSFEEHPFPESLPVLSADTCFSASSTHVELRNGRLLDILHNRLAGTATLRAARDDSRMQARIFYSAILAALASLLLGNKKTIPVALVTFSIIALMYFLDVHISDVNRRADSPDAAFSQAINILANATPQDSTWYTYNPEAIDAWLREQEATSVLRKIRTACRPDLEQRLYYFFPGIALYFIARSLFKRA